MCHPRGEEIGRVACHHGEVMRKGNRCQGPAFDRRRPETDAAVIIPELQQGLIDAQRIGRIGPLIADHAMPEQDPGRQRQHLFDEGRRRQAALPSAEPNPVQPGEKASLGVAALINGQGAAGGAGVPAGAGDRDRAGFDVVRREGQG